MLRGVAIVGGGGAFIGLGGITILRHGDLLGGAEFIGLGAAGIGSGITILRRTAIVLHAVDWLISLAKDTDGEALHNDDPAL